VFKGLTHYISKKLVTIMRHVKILEV